MLFTTLQISDFHERKIRRNVFRQGRIQNFHTGGAAGSGGAVLLAKGRQQGKGRHPLNLPVDGAIYLLRFTLECCPSAE